MLGATVSSLTQTGLDELVAARKRVAHLEAHVRTLREAAETSIARCPIGCHAGSFCGQCAELLAALAATEPKGEP